MMFQHETEDELMAARGARYMPPLEESGSRGAALAIVARRW